MVSPTATRDGPVPEPLEALGLPRSASQIIRFFALRPTAVIHGRRLQRVLGTGSASLQRDLERLVALGALVRLEGGRLVRYTAEAQSPLWVAFRIIIGSTSDPTGLVRDALRDVSGVQAAFVFGSTATETRHEDSDVDVFVLEGPDLDRRSLFGQLAEVGLLLKTEVNTIRYTPQTLAERLGDPNHSAARFIRVLLEGPKRWVAGNPAVLGPLATAAGVRIGETGQLIS